MLKKFLLIQRAKRYARKAHHGQRDDDGKVYYKHPLKVYKILKLVTDDVDILCAGLLHDVIEDTSYTHTDIHNTFNFNIGNLVMECTCVKKKTGKIFPWLETREGIMIKFADRLSNISRMNSWNEKRRKKYLKKSTFWRSE